MARLDDLIDFIKNNPPKYWSSDMWEINLTRSIPNWRDIITDAYKDPLEWKQIENIRPKRDYDNLCSILVRSIGLELAKKWFYSDVDDQKSAVIRGRRRGWLEENIHLWSEFDSNMKREVLTKTFDQSPGEPFELLKELSEALRYYVLKLSHRDPMMERSHRDLHRFLMSVESFFISGGYIPSPEIEKLCYIIEEAGDTEYLAKIDKMISRRQMQVSQMQVSQMQVFQIQQRPPCNPNRNERELIARLIEITGRNGYSPIALPPILLSSETPPVFVAHPELEEDEDAPLDDMNEKGIPRNRGRRQPETISIEELLGVYQPQQEQIIIYERGIRWRRHRLDEKWLFAVVLIHEIAHWIMHMLPKPGAPTWKTDLYVLGEQDVHEGWAQLMTYWIAEQVGGEFKRTFERLNSNQPPPYRVFEEFKNEPIDKMMASLETLRSLSRPVQLQDWKEAIDLPTA